jgi:hypothetical protein
MLLGPQRGYSTARARTSREKRTNPRPSEQFCRLQPVCGSTGRREASEARDSCEDVLGKCFSFENASRLRCPTSFRVPQSLRNPHVPSVAQNAGAKAALSRHPPLHSNSGRLRIPSSPPSLFSLYYALRPFRVACRTAWWFGEAGIKSLWRALRQVARALTDRVAQIIRHVSGRAEGHGWTGGVDADT